MDKIIKNYIKMMVDNGWRIRPTHTGDFIPTYEFERFIVDMSHNILDHTRIEITLYTKDRKKGGFFYVLNGDFYETPNDVIEELKRFKIK